MGIKSTFIISRKKINLANFINRLNNKIILIKDKLIRYFISKKYKLNHNNIDLEFTVPNFLCYYRAKTFSSKEPETLDWIDNFKEKSVFWDIGANIGLYSIYAAKIRNCSVYSFEPSIFNLEQLGRNIHLNSVENLVNIVPIALNDKNGFSLLTHSNLNWGGAHSTFEKNHDFDGKEIKNILSYRTLGLSLDFVTEFLLLHTPDYIKIDVDGIEHYILSGGTQSIRNAKEILIEINEDFSIQRDNCIKILSELGFKLKYKGLFYDQNYSVANQIWYK